MSVRQKNRGKTRTWLSLCFHSNWSSSGTKSICMASSGAVMCSLRFYRGEQVRLRPIRDSLMHCSHVITNFFDQLHRFFPVSNFVSVIPGCFPNSPSRLRSTSFTNCFGMRVR